MLVMTLETEIDVAEDEITFELDIAVDVVTKVFIVDTLDLRVGRGRGGRTNVNPFDNAATVALLDGESVDTFVYPEFSTSLLDDCGRGLGGKDGAVGR